MASSLLSLNSTLRDLLDAHLSRIAAEEGLDPQAITDAISAGTMVLLGNPAHKGVKPIIVGQPSRIKVNANIGTSPLCNCLNTEERKLKAALDAGADTVMDLSIAGDLDAIRQGMLAASPAPLGTVPMYAVGQQILDADRDIASMKADDLFNEIEKQARQGVDFMTVHCGLSLKGAQYGVETDRVMGVVSRGGSMLSRWMLENQRENPLLEYFDRLIDVCRQYNVTLSLGDGLRPGAGVDAGDAAQWEEVINLGRLLINFPAPILLALMLSDLRVKKKKKVMQTVFTFPHFLSWVIVASIMTNLLSVDGLVNSALSAMGLSTINFLGSESLFQPMLYITDIWKSAGYSSIIYLSAISGIDQDQYEAAEIDGATRWQRIWHVTLPNILPTISVLFIMTTGNLMTAGFDQIFNLSNAATKNVAEVLDMYIYRITFTASTDFGFSTAVSLFRSIINMTLLVIANKGSKMMGGTGLFG